MSHERIIGRGQQPVRRETGSLEIKSVLDIYLEEVGRYPALTPFQEDSLFSHIKAGRTLAELRQDNAFAGYVTDEEENKYAYAFQQSKTLEELAFRCKMGLVAREVRRYRGLSQPDLIQEGNLGLMRAIQKHDPLLGRFDAYAKWWIRGALYAAMPDVIHPVYIPRGMLQQVNRARRIETEILTATGQRPSETELREVIKGRTGLSDATVDTIFGVMNSGILYPASLDRNLTEDEDVTLYDFVADKNTDVEQEVINRLETGALSRDAIIFAENEELKKRKRPSAKEVAQALGKSIPSAQRALKRLVQAGLLPPHPRDHRTVDETGFTEHTRRLDSMIEQALKANPKLRNKELVGVLAEPNMLGVRVSTLTIQRSRLRLAASGRAERRILEPPVYRALDDHVEEMLKRGITYRRIAEDLRQPLNRVQASGFRLRQAGRAESRAVPSHTRAAVLQYLEEHTGERINLSAIARRLSVSRERIRQIYNDFTKGKEKD